MDQPIRSIADLLREKGVDKTLEFVKERDSQIENNNIEDFEEHKKYATRATMPLTDLGNAERLMFEHGSKFRYHVERKKWLFWNGKYWEVDKTNQLKRLAIDIVKTLEKELEHVEEQDWNPVLSHIKRSQGSARINAMLNLADSVLDGYTIDESRLDTHDFKLNVANGILDLDLLEQHGICPSVLLEHDRAAYMTKYMDVKFNPGAKCPIWERFLETTFMGNKEMIAYIQRTIGYALTGSNKEEVMFILLGLKGRNGKSVFINTIQS
ncbi:hypothetical protein [Bacillus sp. Marseille-P3661]|uniref:hypothetical protein n=1 Tax=Bacillus sp. Marseille-P3661 TaxID=1936234 RepID=UPI000C852812|nr:hypothetical protein [Bacillus sp. Marseille-P3661]